ncbi:hypothetical protein C8J57DRAFT_630424 [Mycena rebaudengoi]|nr:hypothetical protein C8J57DRAFT_630424 [Mycena rebaudengoi]
MSEVVAGFAGASTTLAAARASASAGFTGRHESAHRSELAEPDPSLHRHRSASQSGSEMSFQEEDNFRKKLNASQESLNEYYRSLNAYKNESWFRLPSKIKKRKAVRKMKRAARDVNQGLRECVDNLSDSEPDLDASSISAESGSPPGSALERERIGIWIRDLVLRVMKTPSIIMICTRRRRRRVKKTTNGSAKRRWRENGRRPVKQTTKLANLSTKRRRRRRRRGPFTPPSPINDTSSFENWNKGPIPQFV